MGSQILKISPFASSRTFILNSTHLSRTVLNSPAPNNSLSNSRIKSFSFAKPIKYCTTLSGLNHRRGFRGGVVAMAASGSVSKSEEEWRAILSPEQFRILRQKGTEYPGTGEYDKFFEEGIYKCAGCGTPLYRSTTKFNSGCGWPAFYEGLPGAINRNVSFSFLVSLRNSTCYINK
ncbi:peptide methionine sulfoxide reductase B5-like [Olea europaea subsp. europaea]|uniref:Peptide methionine sulfoxide reductase B5-like n=1 Tax=Olea europaea subsp. europaea TaxID=158383 RepID=A0A8S0QVV2_OLEEU|nr:peptide methionine sulfoxide reductase B5-like [Olea europaea subsp. europaea]